MVFLRRNSHFPWQRQRQGIGSYWKMLPGALPVGKVCTTVLFVSLIAIVLFPDIPSKIVDLIAVVDACFLGVSFVCYICAYYGKNKKVQDLDTGL